jgi:glycosyltransferase involved in cell wall biosynthesis
MLLVAIRLNLLKKDHLLIEMLNVSVVILTYNEEKHIARCILSAQKIAHQVFIVDSFSTDNTLSIAASMGVMVVQNKWENNHAIQFNWGLNNLPIQTEWVFKLDADEYLTDELIQELELKIPSLDEDINGIAFPLKRYFLNKYVKRGIGKMNLLRMFKTGKAKCENRWMDEHIQLTDGKVATFENAFCDHNLNNITWWTNKHNGYSIREAIDLLNIEYGLLEAKAKQTIQLSPDAQSKRDKKMKYIKMPLFFRAFVYFIYRYVFLLGFTEGKEGFLWHVLQGWWYRTLVDAKLYEIKRACGNDTEKMKKFIQENYQIKL